MIEAPVAAAIGAGLDISRPHGSMVVTLGEGVSDIGVLSMNRLSVSGSIAMGGAGTDTALETADVVLMEDDIGKLPFTIKLSRLAMQIIRQNISFSICINFYS